MGHQSPAECGQRLRRREFRRQVVPHTCGNNREGTIGDSWQPDGWHYQTATCHCRQNEEMLVSDAIEWPEVLWRESVQDFVRQDVRRSWTKHAVGHIASADWLMRQWCGQPNSALPTPNADPDSLSLSDPSFTPRHLKVWTAVKTLWSNTHMCINSVWTFT